MKKKFQNFFNSINSFRKDNPTIFIFYCSFIAVCLLCWILVGHVDILTTADHSLCIFKGHFFDFYSYNAKLDGGQVGCNYFPTLFYIFAIWNLPFIWKAYNSCTVGFALYNRLLSVIFYVLTAIFIFKICFKILKISKQKSHFATILYLCSPIGFFSQFIFCQYDSIGVFFMISAIYFYFKYENKTKGLTLFSILFSLSTTCKYFSIIIYLIFLLSFNHKNYKKIIKSLVIFVIPIVLEMGLYLITDRQAFIDGVFKFGAASYIKNFVINIGMASIYVVPLIVASVLVYVYIKSQGSNFETKFKNATYICSSMSLIMFSLMTWHPQWLLFFVPFLSLSLVNSKYVKEILLINVFLSVVYVMFISNFWQRNVDHVMLRWGVFRPIFISRPNIGITMNQILGNIDRNLLFTCIVIAFGITAAAVNPRFSTSNKDDSNICSIHYAYPSVVVLLLIFFIPAFICLSRQF